MFQTTNQEGINPLTKHSQSLWHPGPQTLTPGPHDQLGRAATMTCGTSEGTTRHHETWERNQKWTALQMANQSDWERLECLVMFGDIWWWFGDAWWCLEVEELKYHILGIYNHNQSYTYTNAKETSLLMPSPVRRCGEKQVFSGVYGEISVPRKPLAFQSLARQPTVTSIHLLHPTSCSWMSLNEPMRSPILSLHQTISRNN